MKYLSRIVASLVFCVASSSYAQSVPTVAKLEGLLAESFEGLKSFKFVSSENVSCTMTVNQDRIQMWRCFDKQGATATFSNSSHKDFTINFAPKYFVEFIGKNLWRFTYLGSTGSEMSAEGIPANTPSRLTWWFDDATPQKVTVQWELEDLGIKRIFFTAP